MPYINYKYKNILHSFLVYIKHAHSPSTTWPWTRTSFATSVSSRSACASSRLTRAPVARRTTRPRSWWATSRREQFSVRADDTENNQATPAAAGRISMCTSGDDNESSTSIPRGNRKLRSHRSLDHEGSDAQLEYELEVRVSDASRRRFPTCRLVVYVNKNIVYIHLVRRQEPVFMNRYKKTRF